MDDPVPAMPRQDAPDPLRGEQFGIERWGIVVLALVCALWVVLPDPRSFQHRWLALVGASAAVLVTLAMSLGAAWLAWRFGGRSRRKATIVCVVLAALAGLGTVGTLRRHEREEEAWQEFVRVVRAARAEQASALAAAAEGGVPERDRQIAVMRGMADAYRRASQRIAGRTGQVLRAAAGVLDELIAPVVELDASIRVFQEAGGPDPTTFTATGEIEARIEMLDRVIAAQQAIINTARGIDERWASRLRGVGASPRMVAELRWDVGASLSSPAGLAMQAAQREVMGRVRETLELLLAEWGRWRIDPQTNGPVFDDAAAADRYNALLDAVDAAVESETATLGEYRRERQGNRTAGSTAP